MKNSLKAIIAALLVLHQAPEAGAAGTGFALEFHGELAGYINSWAGGGAVREDPQPLVREPIAYEDIVMSTGFGMKGMFYDWISRHIQFGDPPVDGTLQVLDYRGKVQFKMRFDEAFLTGLMIPACDRSSQEEGRLVISMSPRWVETMRGGETMNRTLTEAPERWMVSNFRLDIPGLKCAKVERIEPITFRMVLSRESITGSRPFTHVVRREQSNLKVRVPLPDVDGWMEWHRHYLLEGDAKQVKSGELTLIGERMSKLATIKLLNMGIVALRPVFLNNSTSNAAGYFEAELEGDIQFKFTPPK